MTIVEQECLMCQKKFKTKQVIKRKGLLKGHKVLDSFVCSKKCDDKLNKLIEGY